MTNLSDSEKSKLASERAYDSIRALCEKERASIPKILKELSTIAFSDITDYVTVAEGGEIQAIPVNQINTKRTKKTRAVKKIIERTKITESADGQYSYKDSRIEYELYDKLNALQYLCKLQGYEPSQRVQLSGEDGEPLTIRIIAPDADKGVKVTPDE